MAFTVEGKDGTKITVDTIEELKQLEELGETSEEPCETPEEIRVPSEEDSPLLTSERLKEGDKVRILTEPGNYGFGEFHGHVKGSIGIVTEVLSENNIEVEAPGALFPSESITQMHSSDRLERVDSLGKDANGEDLFEGDYVTGASGKGYTYTNDSVIMKVILKEDAEGYGINADIGVEIVGDHRASIDSFEVQSERFVRLSRDLDEAMEKFAEIKSGEDPEEDDLLPVGTRVRVLQASSCGDLQEGEEGTISWVDKGCASGLEYSVRVREGSSGYGWFRKDGVEVIEEKTFKVGDTVRVTGNSSGHSEEVGEVRKITEVDRDEPKYNLSRYLFGSWANTADIEPVSDSEEFQTGDLVKVTETFEDGHGDKALRGKILEYDDKWPATFVGTILLEGNHDKIQLVCRKEDRKDIEL